MLSKITASAKPRILIYGIERVGLKTLLHNIQTSNFDLEFASLKSTQKFQDYDGVILFQSTFETIEEARGSYYSSGRTVHYDRDELVKRRNQTSQLLDKGSFICFLIFSEFIDYTKYQDDLKVTDLSKLYLNHSSFYRTGLGGDYSITKIYRDEFKPFLKDYGIARVEFSCFGYDSLIKKICDTKYQRMAGFIMAEQRYFIPCRLPSEDEIEDFFKKLASALVATSKKLIQELPDWVNEYQFKEEEKILTEEAGLQNRIEKLMQKKEVYKKYKQCLCYSSELLVDSIANILKEGLGFAIDDKQEQYIEDRAILDKDKNELVLLEVKGTNENVKSNNIYQTDSHRGRRGKPSSFPSVLIVNTFIKSSNSIEDKAKDINSEQVKLAAEKNVLVLRAIDLLNLLYLAKKKKITKKKIEEIFTREKGWLKVTLEGYSILTNGAQTVPVQRQKNDKEG